MKLERLNENQIRCTLTKSDLDERHLRLSELAYGSTKARELFQDMIQQAASELGFETENIPLMIEAIPISSDCLILVVTKVENPEELDNRFSRFSNFSRDLPFGQDNINDEDYLDMDDYSALADEAEESPDYSESDFDPLGLIAPLTQAISEARKEAAKKNKKQEAQSGPGGGFLHFLILTRLSAWPPSLTPSTKEPVLYIRIQNRPATTFSLTRRILRKILTGEPA